MGFYTSQERMIDGYQHPLEFQLPLQRSCHNYLLLYII